MQMAWVVQIVSGLCRCTARALGFVWAKPRLCGAFLGSGAPQGESLAQPGNLANSVLLEPVALVLLAQNKSAIGAVAAAAAAAAQRERAAAFGVPTCWSPLMRS